MYKISNIIDDIYDILNDRYISVLSRDREPEGYNNASRDKSISMYDCAGLANILYAIGRLDDKVPVQRMTDYLQSCQDPESGLFTADGHYATHTTAFVSGALDVLGSKPLYAAVGFDRYKKRNELYNLMNSIDWDNDPWLGAHIGSGIYASMLLTGNSDKEWENMYFEWLDNNEDPVTGMWRIKHITKAPFFHYIAAAFHYVFNYAYAGREIPYGERMQKMCIEFFSSDQIPDFSEKTGWECMDYSYTVYKLCEMTGMRKEETEAILKNIADLFIPELIRMDEEGELPESTNKLLAVVSAVAVLQKGLPGYIHTGEPLKLVLDKRPFI